MISSGLISWKNLLGIPENFAMALDGVQSIIYFLKIKKGEINIWILILCFLGSTSFNFSYLLRIDFSSY